jgi:hypothetical protein
MEIRYRSNWRGTGDQKTSSFFLRIRRTTLKPQRCSPPRPYRRVVKGMRNSAYHPSPSRYVATSQAPSQLVFTPAMEPAIMRAPPNPPCPSRVTCPSYSIPAGVVPKT